MYNGDDKKRERTQEHDARHGPWFLEVLELAVPADPGQLIHCRARAATPSDIDDTASIAVMNIVAQNLPLWRQQQGSSSNGMCHALPCTSMQLFQN